MLSASCRPDQCWGHLGDATEVHFEIKLSLCSQLRLDHAGPRRVTLLWTGVDRYTWMLPHRYLGNVGRDALSSQVRTWGGGRGKGPPFGLITSLKEVCPIPAEEEEEEEEEGGKKKD